MEASFYDAMTESYRNQAIKKSTPASRIRAWSRSNTRQDSPQNDQVLFHQGPVQLIDLGSLPSQIFKNLKGLLNDQDDRIEGYLVMDLGAGYMGLVVNSNQVFIHRLSPNSTENKHWFNFSLEDDDVGGDVVLNQRDDVMGDEEEHYRDSGEYLPLVELIPRSNQPPGLLMVHPKKGTIKFWPNIHRAMLTVNSYKNYHGLNLGEVVAEQGPFRFVVPCFNHNGVLLGTDLQLHFIELSSEVTHHSLTTQSESVWRLISWFDQDEITKATPLLTATYDSKGSRYYGMTKSSVLRWDAKPIKWLDCVNVLQSFKSHIVNKLPSHADFDQVTLIDMIMTNKSNVILLIRCLSPFSLALVLLDDEMNLLRVIKVNSGQPTALDCEVLSLNVVNYPVGIDREGMAVIQLPRTLVVVPLASEESFDDLQVKIPIRNDGPLVETHDVTGASLVSCLSSSEGKLLKVQLNRNFDPIVPTDRTHSGGGGARLDQMIINRSKTLRSILIQAMRHSKTTPVAYSSLLEPYLQVSHTGLLDGLLPEIVDDIMAMRLSGMGESLDIQQQLKERHQKFKALALILKGDPMDKITPDTRSYIMSASQKVAGAAALYMHFTLRQSEPDVGPVSHLLTTTTRSLYPSGFFDTDPVINFFTNDVHRVPELLELLVSKVNFDINERKSIMLVFEVNLIILKALQAITSLTEKYNPLYQLHSQLPAIEPWVQSESLVLELNKLFDMTNELLQLSFSVGEGLSSDSINEDWIQAIELKEISNSPKFLIQALRLQLGGLGENLLRLFHHRSSWLSSSLRSQELEARSDVIIDAMARFELRDEAIAISLRHKDLRSLARMVIQLPWEERQERIDELYSDLQSPFLQKLLLAYADTHQFHNILELGERNIEWAQEVDEFLNHPPQDIDCSGLAWMHDLYLNRYAAAGNKLLDRSQYQSLVVPRKVFLALGKLALFADHDPETYDEGTMNKSVFQSKVEDIDDQLDIMSVHEQLLRLVNDVSTKSQLPAASACDQEDSLLKSLLPANVRNFKPIMTKLFTQSLNSLKSGKVLHFIELIDMLTLKYNQLESIESDFIAHDGLGLAFETYRRMDLKPEEGGDTALLNHALRTVWRRCILFDNWDQIDKEGRELGDQHLLAQLQETALYFLAYSALANHSPTRLLLSPDHTFFETPLPSIPYLSHLTESEANELIQEDYEFENSTLKRYIDEHRLLVFHREILRMVVDELDGP